ncbi:hypothetical protein LSAT2_032302 [Lamellibrachia satsuma]|nr:hypothetical protein LSAT2_032302 [Lamellibrachia satsuma]
MLNGGVGDLAGVGNLSGGVEGRSVGEDGASTSKKSPIEEALWWCQLGSDKDGFKTGFGTVVTQDHPEAGKLLVKRKALAAQKK